MPLLLSGVDTIEDDRSYLAGRQPKKGNAQRQDSGRAKGGGRKSASERDAVTGIGTPGALRWAQLQRHKSAGFRCAAEKRGPKERKGTHPRDDVLMSCGACAACRANP